MQLPDGSVVTIRDFTEEDIVAQDKYLENASDEYLLNMGVNIAVARNRPPASRVRPILALPVKERSVHNFTVDINGVYVGMLVVKSIQVGKEAHLHVHIFNLENRQKGYGTQIFWAAVAKVFEVFELQTIICEPCATNVAPNALLQKMGLKPVAQVVTPAGGILREHLANRYEITKDFFESQTKSN